MASRIRYLKWFKALFRRQKHVDRKLHATSYSHNVRPTTDAELCLSHESKESPKRLPIDHGPARSLLFWLCSHVSCYLYLIGPQANIDTSPSQDLCITVLSKIQDIVLVSGHMFRDPVGIAFSSSPSRKIMILCYLRTRQDGEYAIKHSHGASILPECHREGYGGRGRQSGTAHNGRRNANLGYLHPPAHSTTLVGGPNNLGYEGSLRKS